MPIGLVVEIFHFFNKELQPGDVIYTITYTVLQDACSGVDTTELYN